MKVRTKLIDVLVIVVVLVAAIVFLLILRSRERDAAHRTMCASKLSALGQAILLYRNENKGAYPRARFEPSEETVPTWGTGAWASDPFADNGPGPNDVSAIMFLLAHQQDISLEVFICPATNQTRWDGGGKPLSQLSNWPREVIAKHLSYSIENSYYGKRAALWDNAPNGPFRFVHGNDATVPVMADMNPGVIEGRSDVVAITTTASAREFKSANSFNHDQEGQNVLYLDGHVDFCNNPFVGVQRDNIYVRRGSSTGFAAAPLPIARAPYDSNDSVLLPHAE